MGLFGGQDTWRSMERLWERQNDGKKQDNEDVGDDVPGAGLNGVWMGRAGEWLLIKAPYFRLMSGRGQHLDGMFRLRDDLLIMQTQQSDRPWLYEFAEDQGRLVLRDRQGNLFLYRLQKQDQSGAYPKD